MNIVRKTNAAVTLAGLLIAGLAPLVMAQSKPAVELEGAIAKEQVSGDLKAAVAAYQKIAGNAAAPRDVRAKALLHIAGCYEKEGLQARAVYQQIVRDYADQPAAKQATAKLAAMRPGEAESASTNMAQRTFDLPVSILDPNDGRLTDGKRVVYVDEATNFVMISDVSGANKRVVLKPNGVPRWLYPSRDLSMLYLQLTKPDGSEASVVIGTDGTGYREVGDNRQCGAAWSWDNRYFLTCRHYSAGPADLLRISVADGETRKLQQTEAHAIRLSPDGKYIAYTVWERQFQRVFVAPVEGGEPHLASERAVLMDWTRDGRYLVVAMDLSGSEALYLAPVKDGKKDGEPVFVRYGYFGVGHISAGGAFVYPAPAQDGSYDTWLGNLDSGGRPSEWKPLLLGNGNANPNPTWSPDSAKIAYSSANLAAGQTTQAIRLRDVASSDDRELYRASTGRINCVWASRHPSLFCVELASENRANILSIAVDSGRSERLGSLSSTWTPAASSLDDQAMYLMSPAHLMRWDIAKQILTPVEESTGIIPPSQDERWVVRRSSGRIEIRPMGGGAWKQLGPIAPDGGVFKLAGFTPDGKWLIYQNFDAAGKRSFFRVATDGSGQPERVGNLPGKGASALLSISPDGRRIIADTQRPNEMWILENFEPKQ